MDLGCYGLHAHRALGRWAGGEPEIVDALAKQRAGAPGIDEWLEVDLRFPSGATGAVRCSMVHPRFEMTLRVAGSRGEATIMDFVQPHKDDRVLVRTGDDSRTEYLGTRVSSRLRERLRPSTTDHGVRTVNLETGIDKPAWAPMPNLHPHRRGLEEVGRFGLLGRAARARTDHPTTPSAIGHKGERPPPYRTSRRRPSLRDRLFRGVGDASHDRAAHRAPPAAMQAVRRQRPAVSCPLVVAM